MKIYRKIVLSYIGVCLLPLLLSCFNLFRMEEIIGDTILQEENELIEQVGNLVDQEIFNTMKSELNLQQNHDLLLLARKANLSSNDMFMSINVQSNLSNIKNNSNNCEEAFIYLYNSKNLISTRRAFSTLFLDNFSSAFKLDEDELYSILESAAYKQVEILTNKTGKQYFLVLTSLYNSNYQEKLGCVGVLLAIDKFLQTNEGGFQIFIGNDNGELLIGSDVVADVLENIEEIKDYYIVENSSAYSDLVYGYIISRSEYYSNITMMRIQLLVQIVGYIFMGIFMVVILSRKMYSPIERMVTVFNHRRKTTDDINTLDQLEKSLHDLIENHETLEYRLDTQSDKLETEHIICENLYGWNYDFSRLSEYLPDGSDYRIMIFQLHDLEKSVVFDGIEDSKRNESYQLLLFSVKNVLEEILFSSRRGALSQVDGQMVAIISAEDLAMLEKDVGRIVRFFDQALSLPVYCYLSATSSSYLDLSIAYSKLSVFSRNHDLLNTDTHLYIMEDVAGNMIVSDWDTITSYEDKLSKLLSEKRYAAAADLLEQLLEKIRSDYTINHDALHYLLADLCRVVTPFLSDGQNSWSITKINTVTNMDQELRDFACRLRQMDQKRKDEDSEWVKGIQSYILENFRDPNLNASAVSDWYNVRLATLSQKYREYTGEGVLDTIHLARIKESKKLLKEGKTIRAVAKEVGYTDSRALVRAFKRYENKIPSEYKMIETDFRS